MNFNEDAADLEALFDSISAGVSRSAATVEQPCESGESEVIEMAAVSEPENKEGNQPVYDRVGKLVRQMHDALKELGYDKMLEGTLHSIPDARDRLSYISNLTEQAACRVLNATDVIGPQQDAMDADVRALGKDWDRLMDGGMGVDEFKKLAHRTQFFFSNSAPERIAVTQSQMMEIMMAQDFQDLTGQVIRKVVAMAQALETGMLQVLLDVIPEAVKKEEVNSLLNGPVVNAEGRSDVVASQVQVDDLLDSLGF